MKEGVQYRAESYRDDVHLSAGGAEVLAAHVVRVLGSVPNTVLGRFKNQRLSKLWRAHEHGNAKSYAEK